MENKEILLNYAKDYDQESSRIKLKINHILRVAQESRNLAMNLGLEEEQIKLAETIGLLHDIGRFEQIKRYNTFIDSKSIDHGKMGIKVLFDDGLISKFDIALCDYDIVKDAILNHNRAKIASVGNDSLLYCKMIRDADKIDIYKTLIDEPLDALYGDLSDEQITPEIVSGFLNDKVLDYTKLNHPLDILIAHFVYIYDFNFSYSINKIIENDYLDKLYKRFDIKDKESKKTIEMILDIAKKDLDIISKRRIDYVNMNNYLNYGGVQDFFEKFYLEQNIDGISDKWKERLDRKYKHCFRVANNCVEIATSLNMTKQEVTLAKIIGLLHDIGRFPEYIEKAKKIDKQFDHGQMAMEIYELKCNEMQIYKDFEFDNSVFNTKYYRTLDETIKIDNIILSSLYSHNKYEMEFKKTKINQNDIELYAKILRDSDKLDIFFEGANIYYEKIDDKNYANKLDQDYLDDLSNEKCIKLKKQIDYLYENSYLKFLSFVYDINFDYTLKQIYENDFIDKIFEKMKLNNSKHKEKLEEETKKVKEYIQKRMVGIKN